MANETLEQRLYQALEQIRKLADAPHDYSHPPSVAQCLDNISDVATLACAQVWRAERRVA